MAKRRKLLSRKLLSGKRRADKRRAGTRRAGKLRLDGPWRALPVLGVTQVLAWGSLIYPAVLIVPRIAAERPQNIEPDGNSSTWFLSMPTPILSMRPRARS